jgi:hypothetical protein
MTLALLVLCASFALMAGASVRRDPWERVPPSRTISAQAGPRD